MATATAIPTGTWSIDPVHSSVGFAVRHAGLSKFRSTFDDLEGRLVAGDDGSLALEGAVAVDSLAISGDDLAAHVRSADFLDLPNHPQLRFASRELRVDGDAVSLAGDLTIRGATRPIEATGTVNGLITGPSGRPHLGLTLSTIIDRTDYGLAWNMALPDGAPALADDVAIEVELELVLDE